MHSLVRRYIKTAIAFLFIGLALGLVGMVQRELGGTWPSPFQTSAHTHAILVGFVMLMIQGVALWLFPRPAQEDRRYDPRLADVAYWLVASGTAFRIVGELVRSASSPPALRIAIVVTGVVQVAGIALFFHTMWSRVRAVGSAAREAKGERF